MKRRLALLVLSTGFAAQATAQSNVPTAILPDAQHWQGTPQTPARRLASGRMGRKLAVRHGANGKPLVM